MLRVIWWPCQADFPLPSYAIPASGRGASGTGAQGACRSKARRAEGAQAAREAFTRPRVKTLIH